MANYENVGVMSYSGRVEPTSGRVVVTNIILEGFSPLTLANTGEKIHGFNLGLYAVLQGVKTWRLDEPGAEKRVSVQPLSLKEESSGIESPIKICSPREVGFEGHVKALFDEVQSRRDSEQRGDIKIKPEAVEYLCGLFE